ncbi:MAG: chemotaxis protein CheB, partial [Pseudomonadota bacterium]
MSPDDASSVPRETVADTLLWVGVGSSAGGLEALRELARGLPADANATYIVVQHMAPQHKSMLSELIGRETHLPVSDITNGLRPAPNQIYVTPPNSDVFVVDGELRLVEPSFEPGAPKPSVDRFFRSLAEQIGKRAIGVVLSGTGSDGAYGIEAIRAGGGITIAQDDMSAKYQGMPAAAVATGCVDLIMSPADIGAQFEKITSMPRNLDAVQLDVLPRDDLADVFHQLFGRTRVDFRNYKRATVSRRIERRMTALGMGSLSDYVEFLKSDEQEVDALFKDMLISVTSFFRDEGEFETIDEEIKSIVSKNPDSTIRAWIPGCATGEEVYSIAILFAEALGGIDNLRSSALQIFATDIDEAAVIRARKGFYPFVSLENIDPALKAKYFERVDDGFVVKKEIRDLIIFSVHNLINDPPFQNIDFVSCRNLLIYFQPVLQEQVLACLHYALRQSGVLFLGKSEGVTGASDLFRPLGHERHIFRKRTPIGRRPSFKMPEFFRPRPHSDIRPYKEEMSEAAYMKSLFDGLVRAVGPDCLLVDTELRIKRAFGDVSAFIEVSPGEIQADVSSLVKPEFSGEIRMLAGAAIRRKEKRAGRVRRDDVNPAMCKRVSVYPFETSDSDFQLLIAFDSWKDDSPRFDEVSVGKDVDSSELVQALERDLMHAQEALQQTVEELETSNEELQALNEELQSSNEELQSTNEELETTNEELQSSNEELTTINEELHINSQELAALSHDLRSVLENVGIPFIVTNSDLHIIHSSDEAREFFRIRDVAVSRLHVSQCQVPKGFPSIEGFLREALNQRTKITRQLEAEGSSYLAMATPYADERGAFIGVIFSLTDTSEITASQRELRFIFDNVPVRIWYKDDQNNILRLNNAAAKSMGASVEEIEGTNTAAFFPEMAAKYGSDDEKVITSQQPLLGIVERFTPTASEHGWVRTDKIPVLEGPGKGKSLLVVATDVTREKLAEEALRNSEDRFKVAVAGSSVGLWDWNVKTDELYWSPRFMDMVGISESSFAGQFEEFLSRVHPDDLD